VAVGRDIPPPPPDGPGPFSLGDPARVRALLTAAGFAEPELAGVRGRYFYGPDVASAEPMALRLVREFLEELDDAARAEAMAAIRASLRAHLGPDGVAYRSAMWIIAADRAGCVPEGG
jgi:hypothetical protein